MEGESGSKPSTERRRFERERAARLEAEAIAERVTGRLYAAGLELGRVNEELEGANATLETANRAIKEFVAIASHDMRGPLTSILGYSGMILDRWDSIPDEQKREFLEVVNRQAMNLKRLVDDLLTLSKIEAGAVETHIQEIFLRQAIDQALGQFGEHAGEVDVQASEFIKVNADPHHLERILVNYIGNAFKYGQPPVEAKVQELGEWVDLRVCDHGKGVPEDFIPRLFGKFARGDDEVTRSQLGTGLGLSIVKGLAQANGGDAWYEKNQPNGSVFVVRLARAA